MIMFRFTVFVSLATAFFGSWAMAAEISVRPIKNTAIIAVTGTLNLDDGQKFADAITGYNTGLVVLASDGGNLLAALRIGTLIRSTNFATAVREKSECLSACAIVWLGGAARYLGTNALVGFHAFYTVDDNGRLTESGVGNALVGAYLTRIGLSDLAIIYVTQSHPNEMTRLNVDQARLSGIDVSILPPTGAQAPELRDPPRLISNLE
jgi:hypothetical protein